MFTNTTLVGCRCQDDLYTPLNDSDEQAIRRKIGVYYTLLPKPSNDENVVFSVPYTGSQGLGMTYNTVAGLA